MNLAGDGRGTILGLYDRPLYRDWLAWLSAVALVVLTAWALTNQGDKAVETNINAALYVLLLGAVVGIRLCIRRAGFRLKVLTWVGLVAGALCFLGYLSTVGEGSICDGLDPSPEMEACEQDEAQGAHPPLAISAGLAVAGLVFGARTHRAMKEDAGVDRTIYAVIAALAFLAVILFAFLAGVLANGTWSLQAVSEGAWLTWYGIASSIGLIFGLLVAGREP